MEEKFSSRPMRFSPPCDGDVEAILARRAL
jgi:hypothetical protein